jgi:hypothetical protein
MLAASAIRVKLFVLFISFLPVAGCEYAKNMDENRIGIELPGEMSLNRLRFGGPGRLTASYAFMNGSGTSNAS